VELLELYRFQNMIAANVRFTNSGEDPQGFWPTNGSHQLDEANNQEYRVDDQSHVLTITLEPQDVLDVWAKFPISTGETPQYLTPSLPNGVIFNHVEVAIRTK
jgi:hypothetical protein